ncbi:MAG: trehalose-phosphatase [Bauldia sp.]|nr:trehalose-phosphatase [Bauldia sp.]
MTRFASRRDSTHDLPRSPDGWAFFLDIDGTLIDIAPTPDAVVVPPGLPEALAALVVATGGAVAVLTGRDLDTVDRLFAPVRLPAGAVHGSLLRDARGTIIGDPPAAGLSAVRERLAAFVAAHPAALLEDKGTAVAVHFRADPGLGPAAEAAVGEAMAAAGEGLAVQPGKMVFEVRPAGADKGIALDTFMQSADFRGRRPIAVGDDLTDESMFRSALAHAGAAFRVGAPPEGRSSVAPTAFDSPAAVRSWISALVSPHS